MTQMLKAIWPSIARMPNQLPVSANITSSGASFPLLPLLYAYPNNLSGFLCYFLYWLIQFPFLFVTPHKIRWLFFAKGVLTPIAWLAMIIWAFVKVPASQGLFSQHAAIEGSNFSWAWLSAMNSALGIYASLSVNIPDFTVSQMNLHVFYHIHLQNLQRYAKNERAYEFQSEIDAVV